MYECVDLSILSKMVQLMLVVQKDCTKDELQEKQMMENQCTKNLMLVLMEKVYVEEYIWHVHEHLPTMQNTDENQEGNQ